MLPVEYERLFSVFVSARAVTIRRFRHRRQLIVRKIIAVSDYVCFFCFIFYYQSIVGFNNTHSVLYATNNNNLVTFEHPEIL